MMTFYTYEAMYSPWMEALQILLFGLFTAILIYFFTDNVLRFTHLDKIFFKVFGHTKIGKDPLLKAVGKYIAVFVFLLFLRSAVKAAGYMEVESFLGSLLDYLPHLFLALLIGFFGVQMSRTSYTLVYNAIHFENPNTAKVLAHLARILILFFTFTIVINQVNTGTMQIIPEYLIKSILIGFVVAVSLAFGLAFGLGGREAASEIIHQYLHKKEDGEKNLKK